MAIEILMPALSPTMEEGNLAKWLKKEGDKVSSGDVIAEIETDKATMEVEATDNGVIGKIIIPEGTNNVKVNSLIAVLLESGEDSSVIEKILGKKQSFSVEKTSKIEKQTQNAKEISPIVQSKNSDRTFASPLAKRIAENKNIDLITISGSGPNGRIIKKDVESLQNSVSKSSEVNSARNSAEYHIIPHSNMRKVIAKRLLESKQTVPHFYVSTEVSVANLNKSRAEINQYLDKFNEKVSVNDIIVKACANALRVHPNVNASWSENGMIVYNNVDVSIAVGIQDGLITPIIKNADSKSLRIIAKETKVLIKKAKEGKLALDEFQGGGFSVSNLGMYDVSSFNAIINPPQSAIIAIGSTRNVPKICKENGLIDDQVITITLSCDHRVIDGVLAAEFLNTVKSLLENIALLTI